MSSSSSKPPPKPARPKSLGERSMTTGTAPAPPGRPKKAPMPTIADRTMSTDRKSRPPRPPPPSQDSIRRSTSSQRSSSTESANSLAELSSGDELDPVMLEDLPPPPSELKKPAIPASKSSSKMATTAPPVKSKQKAENSKQTAENSKQKAAEAAPALKNKQTNQQERNEAVAAAGSSSSSKTEALPDKEKKTADKPEKPSKPAKQPEAVKEGTKSEMKSEEGKASSKDKSEKKEKKKKKDKDKDKENESGGTHKEKTHKEKTHHKRKKDKKDKGEVDNNQPQKEEEVKKEVEEPKKKPEVEEEEGAKDEEDKPEEEAAAATASRWRRVVDGGSGLWRSSTTAVTTSSSKAKSSVSTSFASVVQLAKKAALDTKHKMGPAAGQITILHFNDVYNIEERPGGRPEDPVGGAARMRTALKQYTDRNPLVLFSGDALAPSTLSTFTKGEQMTPVLNKFGTHCAVYGNHDFDFGIDTLVEFASKSDFPWLMSNVTDNETGRPLAEGKISHVVEWWGRKIGLIGLVEKEWLETLATINPEEVTYTDFVTAGDMLSKELKEVKGCEVVIALTHMRTHNDIRLAESVKGVDLILGGHDHVYEKKMVNGKYILKSGTDFRNFSVVTLDFNAAESSGSDDAAGGGAGDKPTTTASSGLRVEISSVDVTKEFEPDPELSSLLEKYKDKMEAEMCKELGEFEVDLDGRFSSIRTMETNLGTFICDIMVAAANADFALLNSGTLRSDMIHPAGPFFLKDLLLILPMIDPVVLLELTGAQVIACLENGVSKWPALEGRFPQVSGIQFAFDPAKPPGSRVDPKLVKIGDEYIDMGDGTDKGRTYRMATKSYLMKGKDGYDCLTDAKVLVDEEDGPQLTYAVQNHFKALAMKEGKTRRSSVHHQSLVTMSRKTSLIKQLTGGGSHHLPAHMPESLRDTPVVSTAIKPKLGKQATISDLEQTKLAPKVMGRIKKLDAQVLKELMDRRKRVLAGEIIPEEESSEILAAVATKANVDEDLC